MVEVFGSSTINPGKTVVFSQAGGIKRAEEAD